MVAVDVGDVDVVVDLVVSVTRLTTCTFIISGLGSKTVCSSRWQTSLSEQRVFRDPFQVYCTYSIVQGSGLGFLLCSLAK